jgi:brefeldin A-resistance guanine nucleotide exchange factor 1
MNSSNFLVPPPISGSESRTPGQVGLWKASVERIERILPGFLGEVVIPASPNPGNVPSAAVVPEAVGSETA